MGPRVPFAPALLNLSLLITLHIYLISSLSFFLLYVHVYWSIKLLKKIHVQYTQTESIRLRHLTIRLDSHGVDPHYRKSRSVK